MLNQSTEKEKETNRNDANILVMSLVIMYLKDPKTVKTDLDLKAMYNHGILKLKLYKKERPMEYQKK